MDISITKKWADFLTELTFEKIPAGVVQQTKMYILDTIGCVLGDYALDRGKKVMALGRDLRGRPEATVMGSSDRLHCAHATAQGMYHATLEKIYYSYSLNSRPLMLL